MILKKAFAIFVLTVNVTLANVYSFSFENVNITKPDIKLSDYKGRVVMVVNTASKCWFTTQFDDMQKIYDKYKERGFVVIAVPSDDFNQEMKTKEEVESFCKVKYGVTFPVSKIYNVKKGEVHPFFMHAGQKTTSPKMNFYKYLINKNGEVVEYYSSVTNPSSKKVASKIEELLAE